MLSVAMRSGSNSTPFYEKGGGCVVGLCVAARSECCCVCERERAERMCVDMPLRSDCLMAPRRG